jgi:1,2-diacylglycerol 3-beta-galactosyltransferase
LLLLKIGESFPSLTFCQAKAIFLINSEKLHGEAMNGTKRLLILTSDAGFGHRSAANAVAAALKERHPSDCNVEIVNPLQDKRVPAILRKSGANYDRMVRELPHQLYELGYEMSDTGLANLMVSNAVAAMLFEVMGDLLKHTQPDAIITTYPLYQAPLAAVFTLRKPEIPFLTVITDNAPVHRTWFHKAADLCLVSMPEERKQALEHGLSPDKVKVTGIPVHPDLTHEKRPAAEVRAELGWPADLKTLLAVGGKRVKNMSGILRALNHSGLPLQLSIVAGGDDRLYDQLRETEWHVPAHVYNFVDNMPILMHAADLIACKAGGLIVTESLACGLPILLTDYIEGQETSNARLVIEGGAGELVNNPLEGLETVFHWLADGGKLLQERSQNACRLGYPQAAYDVAEYAWEAALRGPRTKPSQALPEKIEQILIKRKLRHKEPGS